MSDITGFDEVQRKLEQLTQNAEQIDGRHEVQLSEIFPPEFMQEHSSAANIDDFFSKAGIDVSSPEAFEATPDQVMDQAVQRLTRFASWEEMKSEGAGEWAKRRLFRGL